MSAPSVLNLTNVQRTRLNRGELTVYRYVPIGRLLEILRTGQLPFMKVSKWDDPFEGYLIDLYCQTFKQLDSEVVKNKFAFSCWSLASESDHIWRLYTPNRDGVRISANLQEVLRACSRMKAGAVEYPKQSEIKERIKAFGSLTSKQSRLFFVKRLAFRAEKELRLMVKARNEEREERIVPVPFAPNLIRRLLFDPRMDSELFVCLKSYLTEKYRLDKSIMTQSLLYQPQRVFKPNPRIQPSSAS